MKDQLPMLQQNQKSCTLALKANAMLHNLSREYGICFYPYVKGTALFRLEFYNISKIDLFLTNNYLTYFKSQALFDKELPAYKVTQ